MIKKVKKTLLGAALALGLSVAALPASATLTNWYIDTDGAGVVSDKVLVKDYLDLIGTAFVHNTFTGGGKFNFNEVGNFGVVSTDGGPFGGNGGVNLAPQLSSTFVGTGSGAIGGALSFNTDGILEVFSGATNIASFKLLNGSAILNTGGVLPNGTISFIFEATNILNGYFFDSAMVDLSAGVANGLTFGFATTNAILQNVANVPGSLVTDYNAAFNTALGTVVNDGTNNLYVSNNGQFRLAVPEPSMLSLMGLALVGIAAVRRRKSKQA
ncbi:PEP-CTERM sorting domain-containing protein [Rhodoferax sp. PAMC 29310]|uniref:PEP-CTERM sorting domain-containing protein n=1 Tax=Rhodoferax sp. PAMC 29310 TaxID=2822760 RepID=UPI001B3433DF|nr:PEP-CTERM sorting domain-containing protein [Rhodoferax sp. PAMC 29310]